MERTMIDVKDFCRTTMQMPGLRNVYYGTKMTSWIYIPTSLVKGQVELFHAAVMRLHLISKVAGVLTVLHAPESRDGKYRLVVTKCKHLDDFLCQEFGCPVVDSTCERCPSRGDRMKTVDCPNCGGSGKAGMVPMRDGHWEKGNCAICIASGQVPEWDYERLAKLVAGNKNCVQMELLL